MLKLTIGEIGKALAYPVSGRLETVVTGVATDSRQVQSGDLFVAIVGEKVDGHQYIQQALANGAAAVVVSEPATRETLGDTACLLAEDGVTFIQKLGRLVRQRAQVPGGSRNWLQRQDDHERSFAGDAGGFGSGGSDPRQ